MARKMNISKTPLEVLGRVVVGNRQPMPSATALPLAQLRPHTFKVPPRWTRQQITVQIEGQSPVPCAVKIIQSGSI